MRLTVYFIIGSIGLFGFQAQYLVSLLFSPVPESIRMEEVNQVCEAVIEIKRPIEFLADIRCEYIQKDIDDSMLALFGDVDNDGENEVLATISGSTNGISAINPHTCEVEWTINIEESLGDNNAGPVLGDVDGDAFVDLFIAAGTTLQRWEFDPALKSPKLIWKTAPGVATARNVVLEIVDMNQDGFPELIPNGGQMVNASNGFVYPGDLPDLNPEGNGSYAFSADVIPGPSPNGQSIVELVHGTNVYRYNFAVQSWDLLRSNDNLNWGFVTNVSLADMDADGDLDAVLSRWSVVGQAVIWDLQTDDLLGGGVFDGFPGQFLSRITIANFDSDEFPEMALTTSSNIVVLDDIVTPGNRFGDILWSVSGSDPEGNTKVSAYDFDSDGLYEILHRYYGAFNIFRETGGIYYQDPFISNNPDGNKSNPTIGDLDNNGEAEVVVPFKGRIRIYESAGFPWGKPGSNWNTTAFHGNNLEDNEAVSRLANDIPQRHNAFLAQINHNTNSNEVILPTADAVVNKITLLPDCQTGFQVKITLCNNGDAPLPLGTPIALYGKDPTLEATPPLEIFYLTQTVVSGNCFDQISGRVPVEENIDQVFVVLNDNGENEVPLRLDALTTGIRECDYSNNLAFQEVLGFEQVKMIDTTVCKSSGYAFNGETLRESGLYNAVFPNQWGCDSTVFLDLKVTDPKETALYENLCIGEVHFFKGRVLDKSGAYKDTLSSVETGCDSIVTLFLEVSLPRRSDFYVSICQGDSYYFNNLEFKKKGIYTQVIPAAQGCDSIITFELDFVPPASNRVLKIICEGESFRTNKRTYTETGFYRELYKNGDGCDSIVDLTLLVYGEKTEYIKEFICEDDFYPFNGRMLNEQGIYRDTLSTIYGCDSIVVLDLRVKKNYSTNVTALICSQGSLQYNGVTYTKSGTFNHTFFARNGCDSIVNLNVITKPSNLYNLSYEICEGEVFIIGDEVYSDPGMYSGVIGGREGCDSLTYFELTINPVYYKEENKTICEGENFVFQGQEYDVSGTFEHNYQTTNGCDSSFVLNLTVNPISITHIDSTICEGEVVYWNGNILDRPGEYYETGLNAKGCDSITIFTLEILPVIEIYGKDVVVCKGEQVQLEVNGGTGYYRWFPATGLSCTDCPRPIANVSRSITYTVFGTSCQERKVETKVHVEVQDVQGKVDAGKDEEIARGETVMLDAEISGDPYNSVSWYANGKLICDNCLSFEDVPLETTVYKVVVSYLGGCSITKSKVVKVRENCIADDFFIPNYISPNADGIDDEFIIQPYIDADLKWLYIYDRWGENVFFVSDFGQSWDGTYKNGVPVLPGVYVYQLKIECPDGSIFDKVGNITVVR